MENDQQSSFFFTLKDIELIFFSFPFLINFVINIVGAICTMADSNIAELNEQIQDFRSSLRQLTGIAEMGGTTRNRTHCPESQVPISNHKFQRFNNCRCFSQKFVKYFFFEHHPVC